MISPGEMPPALKVALLDTPSATICAGVSCRTQQSRFRVFGWSRHSLPESQIPPNIGHFRKELATGCQPEVRMNSKWEEFGSPNRIRTYIRLVNSHCLLVDCHVVHASKVWLLRESAGETIRRNCAAGPQERKARRGRSRAG